MTSQEPSLGSPVLIAHLAIWRPSPFLVPSAFGALWVAVHLILVNGSENTLGLFHQVIAMRTLNQTSLWALAMGPGSFLWALCAE